MKSLKRSLVVPAVALVLIGASFSYLWMPWKAGRDLVVIDAKIINGWDVVMVQKYSGRVLEPYEVSVLIKNSKDMDYSHYYIDGGAFYWHDGNLVVDGLGGVIIRKGSDVYAKFDTKSERYFHRNDWATPYEAIGKRRGL